MSISRTAKGAATAIALATALAVSAPTKAEAGGISLRVGIGLPVVTAQDGSSGN